MSSDGFVIIAPDNTGKRIDNGVVTRSGVDYLRQRVEVPAGVALTAGTEVIGKVEITDGGDVALGATTDAAVSTDTTGTVSGKLRGLVKILSNVWDSAKNRITIGGSLGSGDLTVDAWGSQKVSIVHSLDHGMFTFDIPESKYFMFENSTQVYTSTNIVSTYGAAVLTTSASNTVVSLQSRRCSRYQPNRGHLFSTALWCPSKTADGIRTWGLCTTENGVYFKLKADGLLYSCTKTINGTETVEQLIDTSGVSGFNVEKGNVYDIQYQWRGVGNYKFFINLVHVATIANLGTLTSLSMANPALPQCFTCTRTTADVSMSIGCVDTSSENGNKNGEEFGSAYAQAVATNGADKPVLVIKVPALIGSVTNTRSVIITAVTASNTKKCFLKIWKTRDPAAITGATFVANGNGSYIETDSTDMNAGAVRATAVNTALLKFVAAVTLEAAVSSTIVLSDHDHIEFTMVRGDYLVVTNDAVNGSMDVICEWGEEV